MAPTHVVQEGVSLRAQGTLQVENRVLTRALPIHLFDTFAVGHHTRA